MEVDKERALNQAKTSCITITELADVLAREKHVPFRTAHQIASGIAQKCSLEKIELNEVPLQTVNEVIAKLSIVTLSQEEWDVIICPVEFVKRRTIQGGPNPNEVRRMGKERKEILFNIEKRLKQEKVQLVKTDAILNKAVQRLMEKAE
jgi:argininosuccinate lyase